MARIDNLTNFLNDVSSAIKQKIGDNAPILASEFDTKIAEIETRGNYQQKSVTISNNGTQIFTPDANYDAIEQIEITTNVPILQLQTKSVEITSNGNISVLPDTEYDGMSQIDLVVNVPSLDTSDATATAEDIVRNKTAYVNGEKITGNIHVMDSYGQTGDNCIDNSYMNKLYITKDSSGLSSNVILRPNTGITMGIERTKAATAIGLSADKLKKDETILGVTGTYEGIDTSDANAVASNIEENKTAYVNGQKITGTIHIPNQFGVSRFTDASRTVVRYGDKYENKDWVGIEAPCHIGSGRYIITDGMNMYMAITTDDLYSGLYITADKILAGQNIWQLDGTATSDANATADDIAKDKTAYVNGVKIVGTNEGVTPTGTKPITENGTFDITSFANVDVNVPTTGVMTQEEYDEAVATLDDLLYGNYQEVYSVMNGITDTPTDEYNGVGGTPTQIENTIDTLLGVNN